MVGFAALAVVGILGAAALGLGISAGESIGDVTKEVARQTLYPITDRKGNPDVFRAVKHILATPATMAPLMTVAIVQIGHTAQKLAANESLAQMYAISKLAPAAQGRAVETMIKSSKAQTIEVI